MQRRRFLALSLLTPLAFAGRGWAASLAPALAPVGPDGRPHAFSFGQREFLLDGETFRVHSGEMHPARIAKEHWRHRIRMARAMGLNTVAIYVMWNHHEREPGVFDFESGNRDVAGFIRLCAEEGMWVYLRPGPYICGEWTNGGLPAYLLRDPDTRLRTRDDPRYMAAVRCYVAALAPRIVPLMAKAGGPVLMLQIENEYSMFADDIGYLDALRDIWREHGVDGPFSVSDGLKDLQRRKAYPKGSALGLDGADVPDLLKGRGFAGESPVWVGEGYPGWLTHWGEPTFASKDYEETLRHIMRAGYSFNLYVVHGGTNFGLTAGSNAEDDGSQFQPVITSYDYGAPVDERGRPTDQYARLRRVIADATRVTPPALPPAPPSATFAPVTPQPFASLWDNLPGKPVTLPSPGPNEILFGQDQGLVVYRKRFNKGRVLRLENVRDYAVVHVDGHEVGLVSRVEHPALNSKPDVALPEAFADATTRTLEVLVDTFGHINFGPRIGEHKGLIGPVSIDDMPLHEVEAWPIPLDDDWIRGLRGFADESAPTEREARPAIFFTSTLHIETPGDLYIDMTAWSKGYLWINGQLLGRYWNIGPQQRLFCPGPWLRAGDNELLVLDLHRRTPAVVSAADSLHASRSA
ncbi:beta-galactosidase [Luteibacter sp. dw_328]|uniref:beta-galactosidase n=1 Tax=Luteibacter sp. dw_328 TaxID=2719796 RepID=UPI001BD4032D|nr:beta-galactosidase [Luteibacter sp. dw_328]